MKHSTKKKEKEKKDLSHVHTEENTIHLYMVELHLTVLCFSLAYATSEF